MLIRQSNKTKKPALKLNNISAHRPGIVFFAYISAPAAEIPHKKFSKNVDSPHCLSLFMCGIMVDELNVCTNGRDSEGNAMAKKKKSGLRIGSYVVRPLGIIIIAVLLVALLVVGALIIFQQVGGRTPPCRNPRRWSWKLRPRRAPPSRPRRSPSPSPTPSPHTVSALGHNSFSGRNRCATGVDRLRAHRNQLRLHAHV